MSEDEPVLIINVLNSSVMRLRSIEDLEKRKIFIPCVSLFFPSPTSIMELIPQCFQSNMLHLTVNDTTLVFHFLKIIGMALRYQGSSCHYINVSLRAVQKIVESNQCIGTMVQGIICFLGPLLLTIHSASKEPLHISLTLGRVHTKKKKKEGGVISLIRALGSKKEKEVPMRD